MPAQPALPGGVTAVGNGSLIFTLGAGESRRFEAANLITNSPPSAALVWTIAWRATDPLSAAWYRQTDRIELGRGRWGTAELGGAGFELRNDGSAVVFGELSYLIGSR